MAFICHHGAPEEKSESETNQTLDEMLEQLGKLTVPGNTLITTLPSRLGLDFHVEKNGILWVEFYDVEISSALVTMDVAEQIMKRAFEGECGKTKERYSDLISEWVY
jgi:hypothetical protein